MDPDLRHILGVYAKYLRDSEPTLLVTQVVGGVHAAGRDWTFAGAAQQGREPATGSARRARERPGAASKLAPRAAKRSARSSFASTPRSATTAQVGSLQALSTSGTSDADVVGSVETWVGALSQMCAGAKARLDPGGEPDLVAAAPNGRERPQRPRLARDFDRGVVARRRHAREHDRRSRLRHSARPRPARLGHPLGSRGVASSSVRPPSLRHQRWRRASSFRRGCPPVERSAASSSNVRSAWAAPRRCSSSCASKRGPSRARSASR